MGQSRRSFLRAAAASSAAVASLSAFTSCVRAPAERIARVGFLAGFHDPSTEPWIEGFRQGLRDAGWIEGKNLEFDLRYAEGDLARYEQFVADFVRWPADVMASSNSDALRAMKRATSTMPILFATFADPVETDWIGVQSLARPGGNTTGVATQPSRTAPKRLELLKEAFPAITRIAVMHDGEAQRIASLKALAEASQKLGVELVTLEVRAASAPVALAQALDTATARGTDAFLLLPSQIHILALRKVIIDHWTLRRVPSSFPTNGSYVEDGGLMAYGENFVDVFRSAATVANRILRGADPAEIPVELPAKFDFIINLKTAKGLGLTIPQSILNRATQVIQ